MKIESEGLRLISAERARQITDEGYDAEHDSAHAGGEISMAAACYAANEPVYVMRQLAHGIEFVDPWPWEDYYDRRKADSRATPEWETPDKEYELPLEGEARIRMLVKSGALIAAEIDRLTAHKGNSTQ